VVTCLPGKVRQPKTDVVTGLGVKDTTGKPKAEDLASETKAKVKDLTLEAKATIGWPRGKGHVLEDSNSNAANHVPHRPTRTPETDTDERKRKAGNQARGRGTDL